MKTRKLSLAITAMAIAAIVSAAVVSCKKETENALNQRANITQQAFDLRKVEDLQAYLKDFKKRMTEAKDNEALSLNDAAWHLASLANCDFCRINVEYDNVKFDTVQMNVNVTDGAVLMGDLNAAYGQMCNKIQQFQQGFDLNNQNLYFINMSINANGNARIALMTTYTDTAKDLEDHLWYFPDTFGYIDSVCYVYFYGNSHDPYLWNDFGKRELQRILNLFEHHPVEGNVQNCYVPTRTYIFEYPNWTDSYGSPFVANSRVFAHNGDIMSTYNLEEEEMCYCLDSYLGLGYDYITNNYYIDYEAPVYWQVRDTTVHFPNDRWYTHYHKLEVQYGHPLKGNGGVVPPPFD